MKLTKVELTPPRDESKHTHPQTWQSVMSNFDHTVEPGTAEKLQAGKWGIHAAVHFNGRVWWEHGQFHEEVWRFGSPIDIMSADTLEELMRVVNDEYGWE